MFFFCVFFFLSFFSAFLLPFLPLSYFFYFFVLLVPHFLLLSLYPVGHSSLDYIVLPCSNIPSVLTCHLILIFTPEED